MDKQDIVVERCNPEACRRAIAFPDDRIYEPVAGLVVGIENNIPFATYRYIFKYDSVPVRKSNGAQTPFPNGEVYLVPGSVKFLVL